jgi:serine/threonine protein kinase
LQALLLSLKELKSLSEEGIVHTDLHLSNILYFFDNTNSEQDTSFAKIVDFGNSTKIDPQSGQALVRNTHSLKNDISCWLRQGGNLDTIRRYIQLNKHFAPELIDRNMVSSSADIYSFGKVIKQISDYYMLNTSFNKELSSIYNPMIALNPSSRCNIDDCIKTCETLVKQKTQQIATNNLNNNPTYANRVPNPPWRRGAR